MQSIADQVRAAWKASGLTIGELLERSGLEMDRSNLQRRLSNGEGKKPKTPLTTADCEALAIALGITLVFPQRRRRAA